MITKNFRLNALANQYAAALYSHVTATSGDDSDSGNKTVRKGKKVGRNDPCPCGSGKKYKKCCGRDA